MNQCKIFITFFLSIILCSSTLKADSFTPVVDYLQTLANEHSLGSPIPLVAIGGCAGAGKTQFTLTLAEKLKAQGIRCHILELDDFIYAHSIRKKMPTAWDIDHIKLDELEKTLTEISNNIRLIHKPTYNQLTGLTGEESVDLRECDLILFEGIYALTTHLPINLFSYCKAGIFVDADKKDIFAWRWERELRKTSPKTPEQYEKHMNHLFADYEKNILPSIENADFIIRKNSQHQFDFILYIDKKMQKAG